MLKRTILFSLLLLTLVSAVKKSYDGYKVYKVLPSTEEHVKILKNVQNYGVGELWEDDFDIAVEAGVMIPQDKQEQFLNLMKDSEINFRETIPDLQKLIEKQMRGIPSTTRSSESLYSMSWDRYYTLEEIHSWLDELESNYPNIVSTVVWGYSNENRQLKGIIIDFHPERENKQFGVIEGTIHAREWISPATITWIIKEFLTSNDPAVRAMAEGLQWHILPVANPDGYAYTFTDNRMWRKNRNPIYFKECAAGVDDDMSNGVDLNRNFGHEWMLIGASDDSCTNTFAGSAGFSEPETRVVVNYLRSLKQDGDVIYYLAFHSYTQLVVIPYSHTTDRFEAPNFADMFEIGSRAADSLSQRYGTQYRVGIAADVLYPMSGTSFDWAYHEIEVPVSFLIELRDVGEYGFLLPPEQIVPNNLEIMDFMVELDRTTRALGYYYSGVGAVVQSVTLLIVSITSLMLL